MSNLISPFEFRLTQYGIPALSDKYLTHEQESKREYLKIPEDHDFASIKLQIYMERVELYFLNKSISEEHIANH